MIFEGSSKVQFHSLRVSEIHGKDRLCAECGIPFTGGDALVSFSTSVYEENDSVKVSDIYFVHAHKSAGDGTCFEKFAARMANNFANPPEKPSE